MQRGDVWWTTSPLASFVKAPSFAVTDSKLTQGFPSLRSGTFLSRELPVPEISRFLGIVITMYFNDHEPPHFHVRHAEYRATFAIDALEVLEGQLPPRVLGLVAEWAALHRFELRRNWTLLATEGKVRRIVPLV